MTFNSKINTGTSPNDGQGDGLRTNMRKLIENDNFLKQEHDTLKKQVNGIKSINPTVGSFKVGGSTSYFYPVVFKLNRTTGGSIRLFRDSTHTDSSNLGTYNLFIDKITTPNYGNSLFKADVSHISKSSVFSKYAAYSYVSTEIIIWLKGGTTHYFEIKGVSLINSNVNGVNLTLNYSKTVNFVASDSNTKPATSSGINFFSIPTSANIFTGDVIASGNMKCVSLIQTSDKKFKNNIEEIDGEWALSVFKKLKFSFYDFSLTNNKQAGLIAQEVEKILPQAVHTSENGEKGLNYNYIDIVCKAGIQHFIKTQIQ